jgi:hypothetical protein
MSGVILLQEPRDTGIVNTNARPTVRAGHQSILEGGPRVVNAGTTRSNREKTAGRNGTTRNDTTRHDTLEE